MTAREIREKERRIEEKKYLAQAQAMKERQLAAARRVQAEQEAFLRAEQRARQVEAQEQVLMDRLNSTLERQAATMQLLQSVLKR